MPSTKLYLIVSLAIFFAMGCVFDGFESAQYIAPTTQDSGGLDLGASDMSSPSDAESDQGPASDAASDAAGLDAGNDAGNDAGSDAGDMGSMTDTGADASADAGCLDIVEPFVNLTSGTVCSPYQSDIAGECDPVAQTGCPDGQRCGLRIVFDPETQMPSAFAAVCEAYDCTTMVKLAGQNCAADQCAPGLKCLEGQCRRWCRLQDAEGCPPGDFCVGQSLSKELGTCRSTCP